MIEFWKFLYFLMADWGYSLFFVFGAGFGIVVGIFMGFGYSERRLSLRGFPVLPRQR